MAYHSSYTGPQIDQAVGNALNKDTSTLSNDVNHIPASSVVKSAIDNLPAQNVNLFMRYIEPTFSNGIAIYDFSNFLPANAAVASLVGICESKAVLTRAVRSASQVSGSPLSMRICLNDSFSGAVGLFVIVGYTLS